MEDIESLKEDLEIEGREFYKLQDENDYLLKKISKLEDDVYQLQNMMEQIISLARDGLRITR